MEYLSLRGISGEAAQRFRLGYVLEPLEGHDRMIGMLSIPYITPSGISQLRFRRLDVAPSGATDGSAYVGSKYTQETGSYTPLFNVRDLHRPEPHIALVEGEFDSMVMSYLVGVPAVGLGGVDQWTANGKIYRRLLEDYERVFVVMDPDEPGQTMAKAIAHDITTDTTNIILPADVNDTYLVQGRGAILKAMGL